MQVPVCVYVCVGGGGGGGGHVRALRIVSTDKTLHFINTLIIVT